MPDTLPSRYGLLSDVVTLIDRNNVHEFGLASARPMLFAHGYGCDQAMWRFVAPAFESDHRVILFDHVGFGDSDLTAWQPLRHGSLRGYADDLLELVHELDLQD